MDILQPSFTLFPDFPLEIRLEIWHLSLPPPRFITFDRRSGRLRTKDKFKNTALWVCTESRRAALSLYTPWGPCFSSAGFEGGLFPVTKQNIQSQLEREQESIEKNRPTWKISACPHQDNKVASSGISKFSCDSYIFTSLTTDIFCISRFGDVYTWLKNAIAADVVFKGVRNLLFVKWKPAGKEIYGGIGWLGMSATEKVERKLRNNHRFTMRKFEGLEVLWMVVIGKEGGKTVVEVSEEEKKEWEWRKKEGEEELLTLREEKVNRWKMPVLKVGKLVE